MSEDDEQACPECGHDLQPQVVGEGAAGINQRGNLEFEMDVEFVCVNVNCRRSGAEMAPMTEQPS